MTDMETKQLTEEELGPLKLIFNYENVFYSFFYDDTAACIHRSREYAVNYVCSGEIPATTTLPYIRSRATASVIAASS